jgi:hypothetical protein
MMLIREIFGTPIEEKIEPVIKVGDRQVSRLSVKWSGSALR